MQFENKKQKKYSSSSTHDDAAALCVLFSDVYK